MAKKIVLAYSGGLDTSVILKWLQNEYNAEIITYTSNLGQEINSKEIIKNAKALGVKNIIIEDLQNVFVKLNLLFQRSFQHQLRLFCHFCYPFLTTASLFFQLVLLLF